MAPTSLENSHDGLAPFTYTPAGKQLQTYYRIFGSLKSTKIPLIVIHGGPGLSHDYLLSYSHLTTHHSIPIILYDQIGSGLSTHLPHTSSIPNFWTDAIFIAQLEQLITHLGIEGEYDILGSSWGGMMASRFAARRPAGLRRLVLSNSAASKRASLENRWVYRGEMGEEERAVLDRCEREGARGSEEYGRVMGGFVRGHVCNVEPPEDWGVSAKFASEDDTVAEAMGDNSFWESSGYMKTWYTGEESKNINVPTLVINGIKEFASGDAVKPFLDNIPDVRLVTLEGTTHSPHFERKEAYMDVVRKFLEE